jgi:hypothetical protein
MPRTSNRGKRMTTGGSAPHSHPAGAAAIHHSAMDTDESDKSTSSSPSIHQPHPMRSSERIVITYSSDEESVISTYPSNVAAVPLNPIVDLDEARQQISALQQQAIQECNRRLTLQNRVIQQQATIASLQQELAEAKHDISKLQEEGDGLWRDYQRATEENNTAQITLRRQSILIGQPVNSENSLLRLEIKSLNEEVEQLLAHNNVLAGRIDAQGRPAPLYSPTSPPPQSPPNSYSPTSPVPQSTHAANGTSIVLDS